MCKSGFGSHSYLYAVSLSVGFTTDLDLRDSRGGVLSVSGEGLDGGVAWVGASSYLPSTSVLSRAYECISHSGKRNAGLRNRRAICPCARIGEIPGVQWSCSDLRGVRPGGQKGASCD